MHSRVYMRMPSEELAKNRNIIFMIQLDPSRKKFTLCVCSSALRIVSQKISVRVLQLRQSTPIFPTQILCSKNNEARPQMQQQNNRQQNEEQEEGKYRDPLAHTHNLKYTVQYKSSSPSSSWSLSPCSSSLAPDH